MVPLDLLVFLVLSVCLLSPCSYGFVEFEDNRDADDAVYELNGKELCGERVIVEHARGPRRDRDGYGGGYWGGGRSKCSLLLDTLCSPSPWGEGSVWTAHTAGPRPGPGPFSTTVSLLA